MASSTSVGEAIGGSGSAGVTDVTDLPLSKLRAAQRALGAATATEAIERALDLAVLQRGLVSGTRAMLGIELTSPDVEP